MKFEKPIINITMFEMESVATQASVPIQGNNLQSAQDAAQAAANGVSGAGNVGLGVSLAF